VCVRARARARARMSELCMMSACMCIMRVCVWVGVCVFT